MIYKKLNKFQFIILAAICFIIFLYFKLFFIFTGDPVAIYTTASVNILNGDISWYTDQPSIFNNHTSIPILLLLKYFGGYEDYLSTFLNNHILLNQLLNYVYAFFILLSIAHIFIFINYLNNNSIYSIAVLLIVFFNTPIFTDFIFSSDNIAFIFMLNSILFLNSNYRQSRNLSLIFFILAFLNKSLYLIFIFIFIRKTFLELIKNNDNRIYIGVNFYDLIKLISLTLIICYFFWSFYEFQRHVGFLLLPKIFDHENALSVIAIFKTLQKGLENNPLFFIILFGNFISIFFIIKKNFYHRLVSNLIIIIITCMLVSTRAYKADVYFLVLNLLLLDNLILLKFHLINKRNIYIFSFVYLIIFLFLFNNKIYPTYIERVNNELERQSIINKYKDNECIIDSVDKSNIDEKTKGEFYKIIFKQFKLINGYSRYKYQDIIWSHILEKNNIKNYYLLNIYDGKIYDYKNELVKDKIDRSKCVKYLG
tara:strand:- start:366 stop:1808 length:1443 start_codon:yes stop_codon:yes gene_type:complete